VRRRATIAAICCGLAAGPIADARAAERLAREISDIPGMPAGMTDVGQDTTGYLWISSEEGLHRYDGIEVRRWSEFVGRLTFVATGPDDRVAAGDPWTGLFEVESAGLREIHAPEFARAPGPTDATYDAAGALWAAWSGRLVRREDSNWAAIGGDDLGSDRPLGLAPRIGGGVLVGTYDGTIWAVDPDGASTRIAGDLGGWVGHLIDDPDGPLAVVRFGPKHGLVRIGPDGIERLVRTSGRPEGIVRRGSTTWVSDSTGVWAVEDDGRREHLTARDGFPGFGKLTVDRDGGLWSASVRGLTHHPQPDTLVWTELSGLPRVYLRAVFPIPDGWFVSTWRGPFLLDRDGSHPRDVDLGPWFSRDLGCADPWGGVWFLAIPRPDDLRDLESSVPDRFALVEWRDGRTRTFDLPGHVRGDLQCDVAPDRSLWILAGESLLHVGSAGGTPVERGRMSRGRDGRFWQRGFVARVDGRSLVAAYGNGEVCSAPAPGEGGRVDDDAWTCESIPEAVDIADLDETAGGRLWAADGGGGVHERSPDGWRRLDGAVATVPCVMAIQRSPAGGMWVLGRRVRWRVVDDPSGGPPTVVERLGVVHGVPAWQNARSLHEEPDGTIWLPLYSGLVRVPAAVRRTVVEPPPVTITGLVADGRAAEPARPLRLRHDDHSLELRWSALSYRDPARIRYRMRIDAADSWNELDRPFARLAGFSPGRHRIELGASLDGRTWSDAPARVEFDVRRPWFLRAWSVSLAFAIVAGALYGAYRLRLAHLLRLERQRTRIAMDLHDEMGAGLGSAGLLVGLLGEIDLDAEERRRIGERAARQIRDLGGGLSDIVWSLRPGTETLGALVLFLRQRAADLFPGTDGARVTVEAPDPCPEVRLDLPVRRNVQRIAVEALHNAARHAGANRVRVTLRPDGDAWVLAVRDDGRGFGDAGGEDADGLQGLGLESMHVRAREIGAHLEVRSVPGEGTAVEIRFRP